MNTLSSHEASKIILDKPLPVVFVDTCVLGDIFRKALSGKAEYVLNVYSCMNRRNGSFHLLFPEQVVREFNINGQFVNLELQSLEKPIQRWNAAIDTYSKMKSGAVLDYKKFDISKARELYCSILSEIKSIYENAVVLSTSEEARRWCSARQSDCKRPAQRGRDSFGDCLICGAVVSFVKVLREKGFTPEAFFVSSNTKDYADGNAVHPELRPEFDEAGIAYRTSFLDAYGMIRNPHYQRGKKID